MSSVCRPKMRLLNGKPIVVLKPEIREAGTCTSHLKPLINRFCFRRDKALQPKSLSSPYIALTLHSAFPIKVMIDDSCFVKREILSTDCRFVTVRDPVFLHLPACGGWLPLRSGLFLPIRAHCSNVGAFKIEIHQKLPAVDRSPFLVKRCGRQAALIKRLTSRSTIKPSPGYRAPFNIGHHQRVMVGSWLRTLRL